MYIDTTLPTDLPPLPHYGLITFPARLTPPTSRLSRQSLPDVDTGFQTADLSRGTLLRHETPQRRQGRPHPPGGHPCLLVEPGNAQADLTVDLEATRRRQEPEIRRFERVGRR